MASSVEQIEDSIKRATTPGFRDKLLAKGQSRSMIWRDGELPSDAPSFSVFLTYDLLSYGYALLSSGIRVLDMNGNQEIARRAFEHAGEALDAVVAKGVDNPQRDFHRLVAAAAYHLGRFSARAYSLLRLSIDQANLTTVESCLARLLLRDLDLLSSEIAEWRLGDAASDASIVSMLEGSQADGRREDEAEASESALVDAIDVALTDRFLSAIANALLAFERGELALVDAAVDGLQVGLDGAAEFCLISQWWCHRLAIYLLRGLWDSSFHKRLPQASPPGSEDNRWQELRRLFITSMYRRDRSEIELWPSQLNAAKKAVASEANLVLSLPTSAGKTRIAELCILACLSTGKRVVFVTPLRALSAQTELGLQRTFQPLGQTVSTLYGSIGASGADFDALRMRDIIVATPEKLDFALRSEPTLLDDVGLIVLDEGHMIGLNEREVRYEAQIQRLLRRADARERRIVCLSAVLPEGDQLSDFVEWLTFDTPDGLIQNRWRPTRLRFGEVIWAGDHARLNVTVGDEKPFIPKFISGAVPPYGKRKARFPCNQQELCLATAWRLMEDGQSVLIFCPQRRSVEPFARTIVDLNKRGSLASVLEVDATLLGRALAIGAEWFGPDHVVLKCLKLGVAIHHGALPTSYRKEIERLLREGTLKLTISSPTLAQGLNLSATALVFHGLARDREPMKISDFRNIVGRAGRAYIDLEGLALYPMFDQHASRRSQWRELIDDAGGREMESGLLRLVMTLLGRMARKLETRQADKLIEYVAGQAAWKFMPLNDESFGARTIEESKWRGYLTSLDSAIFSLLGDQPVAAGDVERRLEQVLTSSLFTRRLARRNEATRRVISAALAARAKFVWSNSSAAQRRGYFFAGVGYETGKALDADAAQLEALLISANGALLLDNTESAEASIVAFAEIVFTIAPFIPDDMPEDWKEILRVWLRGEPLVTLLQGVSTRVLTFIEQALIYRLPWGMEAVRVRALAHDAVDEHGARLADYELGRAVSAVETGTMNRSAAYLIQAGFSSRIAAIKATADGQGTFTSATELMDWLRSDDVKSLGESDGWPTPDSRELWLDFTRSFDKRRASAWRRTVTSASVLWYRGKRPRAGAALRILTTSAGNHLVLSPDFERLGLLRTQLNAHRVGVVIATATGEAKSLALEYIGPDRLLAPHA